MRKKIIPILEIFLIVVIPLLTTGFDLFENKKLYEHYFGFDNIANAINGFKSDYAYLNKRTIFKNSDGDKFADIWKLIKSYTNAPIRSQQPYAISMLKIDNPPTVSPPCNAPAVILIPKSAPIVVVYNEFQNVDGAKIPCKDIIIIGTIADLERWFLDTKKNIRIKVNMMISLMSIFIGLFMDFKNEQKN